MSKQRFEQYDDDYLKFDCIETKLATRADRIRELTEL